MSGTVHRWWCDPMCIYGRLRLTRRVSRFYRRSCAICAEVRGRDKR